MRDVYIVSAARTPIGSFEGALADLTQVELGTAAIKAAIERAGISPKQVDEVILGCIYQSGSGQNIARQAAIHSGIPIEKTAVTVNMLCGSGLKTVQQGIQAIMCGDAEVIVAGGAESMTQAPYLLQKARAGYRMGNGVLVDSMLQDGLTDAFHHYHMGITAENIAKAYEISREAQDEFAANSQRKTAMAQEAGRFDDEIVPITLTTRKGEIIVQKDEFPKATATLEVLSKLRPAFQKEGTVTAGNASGINDGAAAVVLMSGDKMRSLGLRPLAKIRGYASAGVDPSVMGIGPVPAVKMALEKAALALEDIDLIEANEAFAAQSIAVNKELGWSLDKVNVNGGAIALGHPVGASGARILTTLLYEMKRREAKLGLATLCIGGGMGTALIVECEA